MERFAIQNMEDETAATTALFNSFNFYADFLIATLKERFAPITQEPIAYFSIFDYNNWPQPVGSAAFNSYGDTEVRNLLQHFSHMYSVEEKTQAVIEWLLFKTYGVAKVEKYKQDCTNNLNAATLLDSDVDQVTDDTDEEELVIPNILQAKPKPGNMPPAELCFACFAISNAVTERQIKAMNNIKTTHRSSLGQTKLNNQYKIATSSERGKKFNAQKFVDHYVLKSIAAKDRDEQITLQCGTKVPNVFRLKSTYKSNRFSCGNTKDLPERGPAQKKVKVGDIAHVTIEVDDNDANLTGEELAIINEQLRQDELSHMPNEGDCIREDILHSHVQFMEQFSETVKSCFGSNIGVLNSLLMHMHEKNIKGYEFQVSDLKRMLSGKMYRDNSLSMYNKVMEERSCMATYQRKYFLYQYFGSHPYQPVNFAVDS